MTLPDLAAGRPHEIVLDHAHSDYRLRNRGWLPLGPYLRVGKDCLPLPPGADLGLQHGEAPAVPLAAACLPLVPQPAAWQTSGDLAGLHYAGITTLVHEWADGGSSPSPGQSFPTAFVTGKPRAVWPFSMAMRTCNSAIWRSKCRAVQR